MRLQKKNFFFKGGAYFRGNIQLFDYKPPPSFEDTVCSNRGGVFSGEYGMYLCILSQYKNLADAKYEVLSLGCRKGDLECVKMMINKYDCDPKGLWSITLR